VYSVVRFPGWVSSAADVSLDVWDDGDLEPAMKLQFDRYAGGSLGA
jgi:hypothetical protein